MLSKLQGRKPAGKRPATGHQEQEHTEESQGQSFGTQETAPLAQQSNINLPQSKPLSSAPPVLPPIPRVASQYGPHGPVSLSGLERMLMAHGLESKHPDERLKTSSQSEIELQPQLPHEHDENSQAPTTAKRENNFSRPITQPLRSSVQSGPPRAQFRAYTAPMSTPLKRSNSPPPRYPTVTYNETPLSPKARFPTVTRNEPPLSSEALVSSPLEAVQRQPSPRPPISEAPSRPPPPPPTTSQTIPSNKPSLPDFHKPRPKSAGAALSNPAPFTMRFPPATTSTESAAGTLVAPIRSPPVPPVPPLPQNAFEMPTSSMTARPQGSQTSSRSSKTISRFNPISLLSRRRSNHPASYNVNGNLAEKRGTLIHSPEFPDNYDPRIRGSVVHDFSAPRPRPATSSLESRTGGRRASTTQSIDNEVRHSSDNGGPRSARNSLPGKSHEAERQHAPVFKEHFGEEIDTWRYDESDRRNQNTTGIAERVPGDRDSGLKSPLPVFARKLPEDLSIPLPINESNALPQGIVSQSLPKAEERRSQQQPREEPQKGTLEEASSPHISGDGKGKGSPEADALLLPSGLPKHLKSNASSRFSFDLAGVGSAAQEKLLEDKHRQKTAQRARASTTSDASFVGSDDGDFGYDDFGLDDGFEEQIPGVNADEEDFPGMKGLADSTLPPLSNASASMNAPSSLGTSFALSQPLQTLPETSSRPSQNLALDLSNSAGYERVGGDDNKLPKSSYDDDFYFDDGMLDEADLQAGGSFDESVFDDENRLVPGRQLRDLHQPLSAVAEVFSGESSQQSTRPISLDSGFVAGNQARETTDTSRTSVQPPDISVAARKSSFVEQEQGARFDGSAGLTKDNLAAYHNALAYAANKAAVEGRFARRPSNEEGDGDQKGQTVQPRVSFNMQELGAKMQPLDDEGPGFRFDDDDGDMDDDAIIAEANAEALENDDEGFYGQEFGFYAKSTGIGEADFANGGYFGSSKELKRSHSGRDNGQEPSLTPITERSEWSQRNSMISLAMYGSSYASPPVQTPGLAQLADTMQHEDEDSMSLSALMKLRRGAWGDSTSSLPRSSGSEKSFQTQTLPGPSTGHVDRQNNGTHVPHHSHNFSIGSNSSLQAPSDASGVASISSSLVRIDTIPATVMEAPQPTAAETSPIRRNMHSGHKGHSRNSSGAESISYVKEEDEDGAKRWIMEKRRTGESGQMELLGRQILEGGMI